MRNGLEFGRHLTGLPLTYQTATSAMEDASSLLKSLKLVPHPEGGFFGLTYVDETEVPSPFAKSGLVWSLPSRTFCHAEHISGSDAPNRPVCSVIFYLLAPEGIKVQLDKDAKLPAKFRASAGYFHTNVRYFGEYR